MDNTTSHIFADQTEAVSQYEEWYPWVAGINVFMVTSGIPGNLLTIAAYWKYESIRTPTNTLIVNQSVGDLFTCLASPLYIFFNYSQIGTQLASTHRYACLIGLFVLMSSSQSSVTNLLGLSVERFIAICFSLEYYNWVTERTVKIGVIVMWSGVISFNSLHLFGLNQWREGISCKPVEVYYKTLFQIFIIIPCLICLIAVTVLSLIIAVSAVKKRLPRPVVSVAVIEADMKLQGDTTNSSAEPKIEFKVTKMLLMVVGAFYSCWIPYLVFYGLMVSPPRAWKISGVPKVIKILCEISKGWIAFNSFLNPFIYAYKSPAFRRAYCKLLGMKPKVDHNDFSNSWQPPTRSAIMQRGH